MEEQQEKGGDIRKDFIKIGRLISKETKVPYMIVRIVLLALPKALKTAILESGKDKFVYPKLGKFEIKTREAKKFYMPMYKKYVDVTEEKRIIMKPFKSFYSIEQLNNKNK